MADVNTAEVEAKVDAAFGAGFDPTPPAPAAKVVEEPKPEPAKPAAVAPAPVPAKPEYIRVTKQEWDNAKASLGKVPTLESQIAKLTGSMPSAERIIQQVIDKVQSQTPAGVNVEITDEDFAELAADFPEMAKVNRTILERIFKKVNVKGTGPAQPPAQPVDMDAAVEKVLSNRDAKALIKVHPDWAEIVGRPAVEGAAPNTTTEFRQWLAKEPADYQKEVGETDSAAVVHAAIDKFKASQKTTTTTTTTATPAAPDRAAARRAVIADAVTPRADGNPPPLNQPQSVDDAFATGFKTVKRP